MVITCNKYGDMAILRNKKHGKKAPKTSKDFLVIQPYSSNIKILIYLDQHGCFHHQPINHTMTTGFTICFVPTFDTWSKVWEMILPCTDLGWRLISKEIIRR